MKIKGFAYVMEYGTTALFGFLGAMAFELLSMFDLI